MDTGKLQKVIVERDQSLNLQPASNVLRQKAITHSSGSLSNFILQNSTRKVANLQKGADLSSEMRLGDDS